jgi:hypothetical protein
MHKLPLEALFFVGLDRNFSKAAIYTTAATGAMTIARAANRHSWL